MELRGIESQNDATFVEDLCHRMGIDISIINLDLQKSMARAQGVSVQQLARQLRYEAFFRIARERGATKIAVGHTANDQAETVLMWMLRGSGTGGLGGMSPVRHPYVIRPLLGMSREEILTYLASRELGYRIDESNFQPKYFRNQLRLELIPVLKRFNPNLIKGLSRQAEIVREDHNYLEQVAAKTLDEMTIFETEDRMILQRRSLRATPLAIRRRVIRLALLALARMTYGPPFGTVEKILNHIVDGQSGSSVVSHGVRVTREYDTIVFDYEGLTSPLSQSCAAVPQTVPIPSRIVWPLTGQTIEVTLNPISQEDLAGNPLQMKFDAETFSPSLVLRTWQPGDQFCPQGLGGKRKKLKNFFSDIKLERSKRKKVPLLVSPEGILWIGGYRGDHRFRITEATREVLTASLQSRVFLKP